MKTAADRTEAYAQTGDAAGWLAPVGVWAGRARDVARILWTMARHRYEAHVRRMVAEVLYAELSKLSDAELKLRGMTRDNLYRLTRDMAER